MKKRVLVTGATGFVGRHVVRELLKQGHDVIATSSNVAGAKKMDWYDAVTYVPFDLSVFDPSVNYTDFFHRPDVLIHLAWEGLPNYKDAFHIDVNLPRHFNFVENLIRHGIANINVTGTCFEYGMQEGCLSESAPSLPGNPYAVAKDQLRQQLEQLVAPLLVSFKWLRLFYLYGEGQSPKSLLSQLQTAVNNGDKVFNMSPGDQLRDYLPIEIAASYLVTIALQSKVSGVINCCSGEPVSVAALVKRYLEANKANIELNPGFYPYSDIEPKDFWGDTKKMKTIIKND